VWTSDDPRECAYVLARLEQEPLSEESIKEACKEAAKQRAEEFALERQAAALCRRIHAMHEAYVVARCLLLALDLVFWLLPIELP
jgi:hypothetical protein